MKNAPALALLLLILCCSALLPGCGDSDSGSFQGYVEGEYRYLAPVFGGRLDSLHVSRGQWAAKGAPLYNLDAERQKAALERARKQLEAEQATLADMLLGDRPDELEVLRARLDRARAEEARSARQLGRDKAQFKAGGISQAQLDESRTAHARDAAQVRELAGQLAVGRLPAREDRLKAQRAKVRAGEEAVREAVWTLEQQKETAPRGGLVVDTLFEPGEYVGPGSPVIKLLPPEAVKVRFFVPEPRLSRFREGTEVLVRVDGQTDTVPARVSYISTQAEYTPPIIYSNETRAKLVFMLEARPLVPAAFSAPVDPTSGKDGPIDPASGKDGPGDPVLVLHPGQPVEVRLP